ncbi:hypothetical protein GJ496_010944 [Pomphorhynchus laevis]|nr:hypothetical protein GJ496_010944 [Pomphorhynchus laevis]
MSIEAWFMEMLTDVMKAYPAEEEYFPILCRQTGFRLTSHANMSFLIARMAFIAVLRAINLGATIGVMITSSDGPWQHDGIVLIDSDGRLMPPPWVQLTEIILNCKDRFDVGFYYLLLQQLRSGPVNEYTYYFSNPKFANLDAHLLQVAELPECQRSLPKSQLFSNQAVIDRRHMAAVLIGYDTRPNNHVYAQTISNVCSMYSVHNHCVGFTSLPGLSYLVRSRNGRFYGCPNNPSLDRYLIEMRTSFKRLLLAAEVRYQLRQNSDNPFTLSQAILHWSSTSDDEIEPLYTNKTNDICIDCGNGMVAPFITTLLEEVQSCYSHFNYLLVNTLSNKLYSKDFLINQPAIIIDKSPRTSRLPANIELAFTNTEETNKVVISLLRNCGAQFIADRRRLPDYNEEQHHPFEGLYASIKSDYCYSFDGDGDRLAIYYELHGNRRQQSIKLLDGTYISILFASFIKSQFADIQAFPGVKIAIVQNSCANSASADYIRNALNVSVVQNTDPILQMIEVASVFDVGIYFTINGHGNVIFHDRIKEELTSLHNFLNGQLSPEQFIDSRMNEWYYNLFELYPNSDYSYYTKDLEACSALRKLLQLLNQPLSDAIRNFFAIEFILSFENRYLRDYDNFYTEVPSTKMAWRPDSDLPLNLAQGNLPVEIETRLDKIIEESTLIDEAKLIETRLLKFLLKAGTRNPPDLRDNDLSPREKMLLYDMQEAATNYRQMGLNDYPCIHLAATLKQWSPKYKCISLCGLMYCISLVIKIMNDPKMRIVVCPDDYDCFVQIYVESEQISIATATAESITLLFRFHVRLSSLNINNYCDYNTLQFPPSNKRPFVSYGAERFSLAYAYITRSGAKSLRLSSTSDDYSSSSSSDYSSSNKQSTGFLDRPDYHSGQEDTVVTIEESSSTLPRPPTPPPISELPQYHIFNLDDIHIITGFNSKYDDKHYPSDCQYKERQPCCKLKESKLTVRNPFYIDHAFAKDDPVYSSQTVDFDYSTGKCGIVTETIPVFEHFSDRTMLSPSQKSLAKRKKQYHSYRNKRNLIATTVTNILSATDSDQYSKKTTKTSSLDTTTNGKKNSRKTPKSDESHDSTSSYDLRLLSDSSWRNSNSFRSIRTNDDTSRSDSSTATITHKFYSPLRQRQRRYCAAKSKIFKKFDTNDLEVHLGCTKKYSYLPGLFPYFIVDSIDKLRPEEWIVERDVSFIRYGVQLMHIDSFNFTLESDRTLDRAHIQRYSGSNYASNIGSGVNNVNTYGYRKQNTYLSVPHHYISSSQTTSPISESSPPSSSLSARTATPSTSEITRSLPSSSSTSLSLSSLSSSALSFLSSISSSLRRSSSIPKDNSSYDNDQLTNSSQMYPVVYHQKSENGDNSNLILQPQHRFVPKVVNTSHSSYERSTDQLCAILANDDALLTACNILLSHHITILSDQIRVVASRVNQSVCPSHYRLINSNAIAEVVRQSRT